MLVGCNLTSLPVPTPHAASPTATPPLPSNGWEMVADGLERRIVTPDGLGPLAQLIIHRIDPTLIRFKAHAAGQPLRLADWQANLPGALGFVNANFFDVNNVPIGLVVSDGAASGITLVNRGGMFSVVDGQPRVRSLIHHPYSGEALEQAVQAFPMLVIDRQPVYQETRFDRTSRRTAVAQDSQGRILLISTPLLGLTLNQLAEFLSTAADLDIINALNLDGGGSTLLAAPTGYNLPSFDPVPVVLAFYPR